MAKKKLKTKKVLRSKTFTIRTKKQHDTAWKYYGKKKKTYKGDRCWAESYYTNVHATPKMVIYWYIRKKKKR